MATDVFQDAVARLERLGEEAGASPELVEALRKPMATLEASLSVRMDDGSQRHFSAFRSCATTTPSGPPRGASATTPV